jgi:hypothetical protein
MMARREKSVLHFTLSSMESKIIERVLASIIANYQLPPAELDEKGGAVWYSRRGCESARMTPEETADWLRQLHNVRSARVEHLQLWLDDLRGRPPGAYTFAIPLDKAETLMTAFNDHRLLLAARHDVGEAEMEMRTLAALMRMPPEKQSALYEIHFLAYVIEELLHLLNPP